MLKVETRMQIKASPEQIYQAFVSADKIGNFWFSKSSEDWAADKNIRLSYDEFDAKVNIKILDLKENSSITFSWGPTSDERAVTISIKPLDATQSIVSVKEQGFNEFERLLQDPNLSEILSFEYEDILTTLLGTKGGWTFMLTCLKTYLENKITTLRLGLLS